MAWFVFNYLALTSKNKQINLYPKKIDINSLLIQAPNLKLAYYKFDKLIIQEFDYLNNEYMRWIKKYNYPFIHSFEGIHSITSLGNNFF